MTTAPRHHSNVKNSNVMDSGVSGGEGRQEAGLVDEENNGYREDCA